MNFVFFLLPLLCSGLLLPKNISSVNATALISSLADANPDDVMEVRRLVDELIAAGEADRDSAQTARDGAQGAKDAAEAALGEATAQHTQTAGELVDAEQEESRLTTLEDSKRVAKEDADAAKGDASAALNAAQDHLDTETIRLDEEKATLERILVLLDSLLPEEWVTVATEATGATTTDNSDWQTLNFDVPSWTSDGNYVVRMEWPNNFMEFTVPQGSDIFANSGDTAIQSLSTSVTSPGYGSDAWFCHACMKDAADKPGDTCWGVLPQADVNRQCGCNSGGWSGDGVYYGGYAAPSRCGGWGGAFAGPKTSGQQKGGISSLGLTFRIKSLG